MNIGIFIGCFNPIHLGHILCAKELLQSGLLDKIIFVPAGDEYEKEGLVSAEHRLNMLNLALSGQSNMEISTIEIENGKLYTYQTLDYFKEKYAGDKIHLIIGTDNLKELYWWKKQNYILKNFNIIVLTRNHLGKADFPKYASQENITFVSTDKPISSTETRKFIKNQNYKKAGKSLDGKVLEYIIENGLFKE